MGRGARGRGRLKSRLLGLASAAAVEVLFLGLLATGVHERQAFSSGPDIEVSLIRPDLPPVEPTRTPPPSQMRGTRRRATPPSPEAGISASDVPGAPAAGERVSAQGEASPGPDDRLRSVLRGSAGCFGDWGRLSDSERQRCQNRLAKLRQDGPTLAAGPTDPRKAAILDHEVRANEAWRSYRGSTSMDDYPGMRVFVPALKPLFGDEPAPAPNSPPQR